MECMLRRRMGKSKIKLTIIYNNDYKSQWVDIPVNGQAYNTWLYTDRFVQTNDVYDIESGTPLRIVLMSTYSTNYEYMWTQGASVYVNGAKVSLSTDDIDDETPREYYYIGNVTKDVTVTFSSTTSGRYTYARADVTL